MSAFIIADLTAPRSTPHEAQVTIPEYMVPFVPIIQEGRQPYSMFRDLWIKHHWVMSPLSYQTTEELLSVLEPAVISPAMAMIEELDALRAQRLPTRAASDYLD